MTSGEIGQLAKDHVAVPPVEVRPLEAERVQIGMLRAAFPRFLLSTCEEPASMAFAAQVLSHPQQIQMKPTPVDLPQHARDDLPIGRLQDETETLEVAVTNLLHVVVSYTSPNDAPSRLFRLIHVDDLVVLVHVFPLLCRSVRVSTQHALPPTWIGPPQIKRFARKRGTTGRQALQVLITHLVQRQLMTAERRICWRDAGLFDEDLRVQVETGRVHDAHPCRIRSRVAV